MHRHFSFLLKSSKSVLLFLSDAAAIFELVKGFLQEASLWCLSQTASAVVCANTPDSSLAATDTCLAKAKLPTALKELPLHTFAVLAVASVIFLFFIFILLTNLFLETDKRLSGQQKHFWSESSGDGKLHCVSVTAGGQ